MVNMNKMQPTTFTAQSKRKPTSFTTWHRCLAHAGAETITQIMTENLVDGLNICGELSIGGLCEDCIYSKHAAHLYSDNKPREKDILEYIHIDIWGLFQVQSAGSVLYFMIIMNGFFFFFFSVEGKLINQHRISPIVWAWLNRPTKNLSGF